MSLSPPPYMDAEVCLTVCAETQLGPTELTAGSAPTD